MKSSLVWNRDSLKWITFETEKRNVPSSHSGGEPGEGEGLQWKCGGSRRLKFMEIYDSCSALNSLLLSGKSCGGPAGGAPAKEKKSDAYGDKWSHGTVSWADNKQRGGREECACEQLLKISWELRTLTWPSETQQWVEGNKRLHCCQWVSITAQKTEEDQKGSGLQLRLREESGLQLRLREESDLHLRFRGVWIPLQQHKCVLTKTLRPELKT